MANTGPGGLNELSRTLKQLRQDAGLTGMQAAERTGFSQAKISRIERENNVPNPADVAKLAEAYHAPTEIRQRLIELAEHVKATNRRVVLSRANRAEFQKRIADLNRDATEIREFSPVIIPGLLQTAEYMQAVFAAGGTTPADAGGSVRARLEGQNVLDEPGRRITILTTEGALGWAAGPPEMMVRQLEHIELVARKPVVRVGIIPFGTPRPVFPVSNWNLYDESAVVPGILRRQVVLIPPDVSPYVEQFAKLEPLAVFDDEASAILRQVADRYRSA
jgi:transcriptional regulator with XRE-family HTH domain